MAASGSGIVWYQKEISLRPRARGCHIVTEEIEKGLPEISQVKIGTCHAMSKWFFNFLAGR